MHMRSREPTNTKQHDASIKSMAKSKAQQVADQLKALHRDVVVLNEVKTEKTEILPIKVNQKGKNGGARPGAGRKQKEVPVVVVEPNKYEKVEAVVMEVVEIVTTNSETGAKEVKKMTALEAILRRLFRAGMAGDVSAMREFMSRAVGQPIQPVMHGFDPKKPLHVVVDM